MGSFLLLAPAVYLAAVFDTALESSLDVGPITPDWLALTAVVWSFTTAGARAYWGAGLAGLVSDLCTSGRVGIGMLCFALASAELVAARKHLRLHNPAAQSLLAWPTIAGIALGVALARRVLGEIDLPLVSMVGRAVGVGAYTACLALPAFMVLRWRRA